MSTQLGKLSGCFLPTNDVAAVQKDCGVRSVSSTTSSSPHLCTNDSTSPLVNGGGSGQLSNGPVAGVDERANKPSPPPSATDGSGTATIGSQNFVVSFGAVAV